MPLNLEVQYASKISKFILPTIADIKLWVGSVCKSQDKAHDLDMEICVRIVDNDEMTALNGNYRQKFYPTNVLSFPLALPQGFASSLLGDIVIAAPVIETEAEAQGKQFIAHFAHMVIHGTLHLMGYDHQNLADAQVMERLESKLLMSLNFSDPYAPNHTS